MPKILALRVLVLLPADSKLSTLGAAHLCKETAASITNGLKKGPLLRLGLPISVDCVDNPIDALVRIESADYNALVVPVTISEHSMELLDYVEILRDLENPIAIYYYRDALAEYSLAEHQAKYLDKNREMLGSFVQMYLARTAENAHIRMVQGEVSDPSLPTSTTKCRYVLGERLSQAINQAKLKKELERSVTRITLDDESNSSSEPDDANEPDDEAVIRSFREIAEAHVRSSIIEPSSRTHIQREVAIDSMESSAPIPSPRTMASIEEAHLNDVTSAEATWLDNIEAPDELMESPILSEVWWDPAVEDIKVDNESMLRLQTEMKDNRSSHENENVATTKSKRRPQRPSRPRKTSKAGHTRAYQFS